MTNVPSPSTVPPIRLKDSDCKYSYIEFPQDTIFLESVSTNTSFRPHSAFVPAQRVINGEEQTHLYEISPGVDKAKHIAGPLKAPDGSTDVTVFGSALTSAGVWYLCAFNRNSILAVDLSQIVNKEDVSEPKPVTAIWEVPNLPSPNDVCYDPQDETTLYVVGGTFTSVLCVYQFSNSARGTVYKIDVSNPHSPVVTTQASGLRTLAGAEVVDDQLILAQLYDVLTQSKNDSKTLPKVIWKGNDADGNVWLADNIDITDTGIILCPAYSTVPEGTVSTVMKRGWLMASVLFYYQISTACMRGERFREAILDPEVALSFSNTYVKEGVPPSPIRLIVMQSKEGTNKVAHFEIDLEETRSNHPNTTVKDWKTGKVLGERYFFNEQVTHTGHVRGSDGQGHFVFVNFECPRILLMNEAPFVKVLAS